jgi:NAD(P)-dependent dehydrogenase (short-subunit alcohol dehydrogenase family)
VDYRNLFQLAGSTALVTGGAGILGRHFCRGLAAFGANLVVCDLDQRLCDEVAADIVREYGGGAIGIACDVGEPESVASMTHEAAGRFGGIDVLVNNAATKSQSLEKFFAPTQQFDLDAWREVMRVNLDGMFLVAREVGKSMISRGKGGSIIQTSSIYGIVGADQRIYEGSEYLGMRISNPVVYSASKSAVTGLTRHLATEWAAYSIRVNTLVPGGMRSGQNDRFVASYSNRVPLGRMGDPQELVGAVVYLASGASSYVTGQCLIVDGGLTAW